MELKPRTLSQIVELVEPLYQNGDLLGFSVFNQEGKALHNESFFDDHRAWQATLPFVNVVRQLGKATRVVGRLTVELEEITLIYRNINEGHALFYFRVKCDLDAAADALR